MKFEKVNYEKMKLQQNDRINTSLITRKINERSNSQFKISEKEAKKSTKVLSRLNKDLKIDKFEQIVL